MTNTPIPKVETLIEMPEAVLVGMATGADEEIMVAACVTTTTIVLEVEVLAAVGTAPVDCIEVTTGIIVVVESTGLIRNIS